MDRCRCLYCTGQWSVHHGPWYTDHWPVQYKQRQHAVWYWMTAPESDGRHAWHMQYIADIWHVEKQIKELRANLSKLQEWQKGSLKKKKEKDKLNRLYRVYSMMSIGREGHHCVGPIGMSWYTCYICIVGIKSMQSLRCSTPAIRYEASYSPGIWLSNKLYQLAHAMETNICIRDTGKYGALCTHADCRVCRAGQGRCVWSGNTRSASCYWLWWGGGVPGSSPCECYWTTEASEMVDRWQQEGQSWSAITTADQLKLDIDNECTKSGLTVVTAR